MAIKRNKVKLDLASYSYYIIMGEEKIGKTTLFYELVKLVTGSTDGGVLISCSDEDGYNHLEDLQYEEALTWSKKPTKEDDSRGLTQVVDDLIDNRNTDWKDVKLVALDTLDGLIEIGTKQVFLEHLKDKGERCKSLNDALGGYQKGKERLIALVLEQISRLKRAGYAIFLLAHTKTKLKEDAKTERKYDFITNNLNDDLYKPISGKAQMVVNVVWDREIKEGKNDKGKVISGKILDSKRMMYFRNDSGLIDAGGRFVGLPEKLELGAENFMKAFEMGVNASRGYEIDEKQKAEIIAQEKKELEEKRKNLVASEDSEDSERKDTIVSEIRNIMKEKMLSGDKEAGKVIKAKLSELGLEVKELQKANLSVLKEFSAWLLSI